MRPIGGEIEVQLSNTKSYFTDSGRSSLRLFLRSSNNKDKKYLIPDFYCFIIESIFIEENINYSFYKINKDLSFNEEEILTNDFDVLYIINYFGNTTKLNSLLFDNKIVIEDNVFFLDFENKENYKNWFAFNSFRKVSKLSSGSLIKTNLRIDTNLISSDDAPFHNLKKLAKNIKYEYIHEDLHCEKDYIDKFNEAEDRINLQKNVYSMHSDSISTLIAMNTKEEQVIRKKRFNLFFKLFPEECLNKNPLYYSYFVMSIDNRDEFRKKLMDDNIFLPIHWPKSSTSNKLYENIISIPLFEIYTELDFLYLIDKIKDTQ